MAKQRCNIDESEIASFISKTEGKNRSTGPEERQQRNVAWKRYNWSTCVTYKAGSRWRVCHVGLLTWKVSGCFNASVNMTTRKPQHRSSMRTPSSILYRTESQITSMILLSTGWNERKFWTILYISLFKLAQISGIISGHNFSYKFVHVKFKKNSKIGSNFYAGSKKASKLSQSFRST